MQKVKFNKKNHTYDLYEGNKKLHSLTSVTQLLKKHGLSPDYSFVNEEVLNAKAERGSVIHEELEKYINNKEDGFTNELALFISKAKEANIIPTKSEFIVHNEEIAGTVDVVGTIGDNELPFIGDFKTTATLHKESVAWQLSLYAYLSGEIYEKFIVIHFPDENTCKIIELQPIPEVEIKKLLECESNCEIYQKKQLELTFDDTEKILAVQGELRKLEETKRELECQELELKNFLIAKFEESGSDLIDNDFFRIKYTMPGFRETLDQKRLKEELPEIYNNYIKVSPVKAKVTITLKD